jgi:hypothetical protein
LARGGCAHGLIIFFLVQTPSAHTPPRRECGAHNAYTLIDTLEPITNFIVLGLKAAFVCANKEQTKNAFVSFSIDRFLPLHRRSIKKRVLLMARSKNFKQKVELKEE